MAKIHVIVQKVNCVLIEQHFDELVERLYPERKSRVLAFRRKEPAYVSVVAGLLLQELVEKQLGIRPDELVLEKNENGKPWIKDYPEFYFNISHAGDYVVLAYGDVPLGVDIEQIRGKENLRVARRCFTEREYAYVSGQKEVDDSLSAERFFYLWTMKESYLKLTGDGISVPLNSFEIDPEQKTVIGTSYRYFMLRMDDYWVSVCAKDGCTVEYRLNSCIRF